MAENDDIQPVLTPSEQVSASHDRLHAAISAHFEVLAELSGAGLPYVNSWVLSANVDSIALAQGAHTSYRLLISESLRHHEQVGLLEVALTSLEDNRRMQAFQQLMNGE